MIEHSVLADQGARAKVFYIGPNFRYERPQKGRYTQHHQFGAEAFGLAEPEQDAECILLQTDFYRRCGVKDLELKINSLGDRDSKLRYRDALVAVSAAGCDEAQRGIAAAIGDQSAADSGQQRSSRCRGMPKRATGDRGAL